LHRGIPVGVQIVAGRFEEARCFAVGEIIERQSTIRPPIEPVRSSKSGNSG
jgi:amidase